MTHGTRATYQQTGCRCVACRAANASYISRLRRQRLKHLPPLGSLISAADAWRKIRQLQAEQITHRTITGWTDRHLPIRVYTTASRIRLKTYLRIRALCRFHLLTDNEP